MKRNLTGRRALTAVVFAAALTLGAVFGLTAPASAHNQVSSTSPSDGAVVTTQPGSIVITTEEPILDIAGSNVIDVVGPDKLHYTTECPVVSDDSLSAAVLLGSSGTYTADWRIVSEDGHVVDGSFTFTWNPGENEQVGAGTSTAPYCSSGSSDAASISPISASASGDQTDAGTTTSAQTGGSNTAVWGWAAGAVLAIAALGGIASIIVRTRRRSHGDD